MKKNKLLIVISSLLIIYGLVGFIAVPKILKPQIEKAINENITQKSSLEKIEFNPFLLKLSIHKLKIFDEKETTVSIEKLLIDFSIIKSIDEQHISFKDLELVNPYINLIEYEDGTLNLQKLAREKKEEPKTKIKEEKSSDIKFQIYRTILDNAKIKFTKLSKNEEPFTLNIDKLNYTFYDMGTHRNTLASHTLKILINNNSELEIRGGVRLDPFKMNGNVELKNFKPNDFLTYKKDMLNFDLSEETYLDMQFGYKVDASKELKIEINNAHLNLKNLDIKQNNDSILSLEHLDIENVNVNYPENIVNIDSIFLDKLNVKAINDKNNNINFTTLVKSNEKEEIVVQVNEVKEETTKKNATEEEAAVAIEEKTTPLIKEENQIKDTNVVKDDISKDKQWKVILNKLNIKNSNISFNDLANSLFVDTKNINIDLSNFKLNGNDFTLEKMTLKKPTINLIDDKNKLSITNKELQLVVTNLSSNNKVINLEKLELNNSSLSFKDSKNSMSVLTEKININLNKLLKDNENISIDGVKVNTPKVTFKDNKNKMEVLTDSINLNLNSFIQNSENIDIKSVILNSPKITYKDRKTKLNIFTKRTDIKVSTIKKTKDNISISSINLKNPSILMQDNKNKLKILTNSLSLNIQSLNLNGSNVKVKKVKLKTPSLKFDDIKNRMNVTTKNINLIATNTSLIKDKLKIAILSLTKPSIYMVDNKNKTTLIAKKASLKINGIYSYKNQFKVSKVNLYEPNLVFKDNKSKTNILAKNIYLNVQKISHKNNKLKIVRSSLNKPYISITLGKQAPSAKKPEDTKKIEEKEVKKVVIKKKPKKKKSDFTFDIGPVKIKNMKMTFEDKNLPIPFKTNITKLNGEFSRLNSSNSKPTKLSLEGTVDEYGYTKITGTVDINDIKLLTDTNLLFKNIAIKNFTPYSGKFVGREIESGKLNLSLKYNIKKSDLNAQNSVVISNIKFGKNVESPDAMSLPLDLAIALLEDSNGVIDLELPVTGNVDDPQFSIAPIVWKVFTNLIIKAITSPFTLLASVFGIDEEDIKSLEFELGHSEILASEKETLDNIAKILSKKPKLAINIKPVYDPIEDKIALQDIKFEQFLIKEMDKIPEGDDYKEALEDLYEDIDEVKDLDDVEESFIKKDKKGKEEFDNDAYVEYLRKFLSLRQKVTEAELIILAKTRVTNILKYLEEVKQVPKDAIKIEEIKKQELPKTKWAIFNLGVSTK